MNTRRTSPWVRTLLALVATSCLSIAPHAAEPEAPPLALKGKTLDGRSVDLGQLRGKVVMVFFWSTECAVCLQKMPELRANAAGWRGKPFELVLVSTDRRRTDVEQYAQAVRQIEPNAPALATLWTGDASYADSLGSAAKRVPLTFVLDTKGKVAKRLEGRISAESWDDVAALMP